MNEVHATYLIPQSRVDGLTKTIGKLARRIQKGKTHSDIVPTIEIVRDVIMVHNNGRLERFNAFKDSHNDKDLVQYTWVTIHYQKPVLDGWHLIAVYDWEVTEDGKRTCYVNPVPGQMVLEEFREVEDGRCDHCHTNRRRKKSMLLTKNFLDYKIVGTSCVKDFLGHKSPNSLMELYMFEQEFFGYVSEFAPTFDRMACVKVKRIMEIAAMYIRQEGYQRAHEGFSTGDKVSSYMFSSDSYWITERATNTPTQDDIDTAKNAMEWIAEQSDVTEYMDNLKRAVEAGAVSEKRLTFVASGVYSYNRAKAEAEKAKDNANKSNRHLGNIKDRLKDIMATVKRVRFTDGYYGTTTIITLETATGDTLVWFASGSHDIEEGEYWVFDGTVKKHDTFNNTRQTIITRVKYTQLQQQQVA